MPFHYAEAAANRLTNTALDPVCSIPELKVCAVKILTDLENTLIEENVWQSFEL